ncbi:small ribosomal subunit protein mS23 [Cottoperca gobio]|uniref:Small ribosomal subunit protein mS23 n=1 Tax=Cottoperca gobio TaxID=56716 RepID=A0A6J2QYE8_COTGO|nr:28S ribosomal protein S23, mitochondrial [Cottoperca gobio]
MAGSRLERFGTVFTRVRDLIRAGIIKPSQKPIWYDVYEAFPPKREPLYVKPHTRTCTKKRDTVPEIFYKEDEVRAKFYEQYGMGPRAFMLSSTSFVSVSQRFIDKYTELKSNSELDDSALFEETGKALLAEGINLRRKEALPESAEFRDPVLELKLTDMLAEQQSVNAGSEETTDTTHTHHRPQQG